MDDEVTGQEAGHYEHVSFRSKRLVLAALCERAAAVVAPRASPPVLRNFLVTMGCGDAAQLEVTGSDLEMAITASSPSVTSGGKGFRLAVPARRMLAIMKEAPEGDVVVEISGQHASVQVAGTSWDLRLPDCSDFPAPPGLSPFEMAEVCREDFLAALRSVRHAISRDGARPPLRMISIAAGHATASDGARYQRAALPGFPVPMQIPAAAVEHLLRIMASSEAKTVLVGESGNLLAFRVGSTTFTARQLMARFPDMDKLMLRPAQANTEILEVDSAELGAAVRRVRINADSETSAIGLKLAAGRLTVISRDTDQNSAECQLPATWSGGERLLVVNHQFLADMLAVWPGSAARFRLPAEGKKKSLVLLEGGGLTGIISQMHAELLGYG